MLPSFPKPYLWLCSSSGALGVQLALVGQQLVQVVDGDLLHVLAREVEVLVRRLVHGALANWKPKQIVFLFTGDGRNTCRTMKLRDSHDPYYGMAQQDASMNCNRYIVI